jgi:3-phenylpropionate/trans-cinnamate dioxygenase ferredoxin component
LATTYIPLVKVDEVTPGSIRKVDVNGREVVVANVDGAYFAFASECPHEGADMAKGQLDGMAVRCTNHNFLFDLKTGEVIESDEDCPDLTTYAVEEHEGSICLRLG